MNNEEIELREALAGVQSEGINAIRATHDSLGILANGLEEFRRFFPEHNARIDATQKTLAETLSHLSSILNEMIINPKHPFC